MDLNELTYETVQVDGRPFTLWSDGRLRPVIRGGIDDGGADAGDSNDGQGDGQDDGGADDDTGDQDGTPPAKAKGAKLELTQAEIDDMIEKRLTKAKRGWETEVKTAADRAKLDETERLKAEKTDAENAAKAATESANRKLVVADAKVAAVAAGVQADRVDRFMRLVDLSDVEVDDDDVVDAKAVKKAVKAALEDVPEFKAEPKGAGRSGGEMNGGGGQQPAKTLDDAVAGRYAN